MPVKRDASSTKKRNDGEASNRSGKRNIKSLQLVKVNKNASNDDDVEAEENGSSEDYEINIKTITGKIIPFKVKSSDTIGSVKLKIQAKEQIPFEQQELFFNEKVLENINTLANLLVTKGSVLKVMQKSVDSMEIFVNTFTGKTVSLSVEPTDTIAKVKLMVESKEYIPYDEQALVFNNMILGDSGTLFDFQINTKSTLTLMRKSRGFMDIFVKTLTGETITLRVKPLDTIESIKAKIENMTSIPSNEQELIFNGMVLHNNDTLVDFHINKESTLTLMHLASGFMRIYIDDNGTGKTISLDVKPSDTIHKVKVKIFNKEGTRPCEQRLLFDGRHLQESPTLADYHILNESTIDLLVHQRGC